MRPRRTTDSIAVRRHRRRSVRRDRRRLHQPGRPSAMGGRRRFSERSRREAVRAGRLHRRSAVLHLGGFERTAQRIADRLRRAGHPTQLRDGDYLAAITTGADRFTDDLTGASGGFTVILVVILIAGAAFLVIWLIVRSRRKRKTSAVTGDGSPQAPAVPLQELERQASSALIATDDALKTSNQELGFATAQFGDAATSEFVTVIAHARADLDEALRSSSSSTTTCPTPRSGATGTPASSSCARTPTPNSTKRRRISTSCANSRRTLPKHSPACGRIGHGSGAASKPRSPNCQPSARCTRRSTRHDRRQSGAGETADRVRRRTVGLSPARHRIGRRRDRGRQHPRRRRRGRSGRTAGCRDCEIRRRPGPG